MSGSPSLRGCGDTLTRRLASLRADILARGVREWHVSAMGFPSLHLRRESSVPKAFNMFRRLGASVVHVCETSRIGKYCVHVDKGCDWLLLSEPVLITSLRCERSESAERKNGKACK